MRAFLHKVNSDGHNTVGTENAAISREYKSFRTLWRYAIVPFAIRYGNCHAEIFNNWNDRYGKPDKDVFYNPKK